jgi:hypothetical protein
MSTSDADGLGHGLRTGLSASVFSGTGDPFPVLSVGLFARWDLSRSSSLTLIDNKISQANDLTGNGNHVTQGTAADRPALTTINGVQVGDFRNNKVVGLTKDPMHASLDQPFSAMLIVSDLDLLPLPATALAIYQGSTNSRGLDVNNTPSIVPDYGVFLVGQAYDQDPHIIAIDINGVSSSIWLDGGTAITANAGANDHGTEMHLGYDRLEDDGASMKLAECLFSQTVLSTADKNIVGNYWGTKYGITWTNIS